jgi:hypothetical protein
MSTNFYRFPVFFLRLSAFFSFPQLYIAHYLLPYIFDGGLEIYNMEAKTG